MRPEFHQHPEGTIYIRTERGIYSDTPENFELDFGQPLPPLPEGAIERIYVPGIRHPISDGTNVVAGGEMPWDYGDQAIAAIDALLTAQTKRTPPPPEFRAPSVSPNMKQFDELKNLVEDLKIRIEKLER